MKAFLDYNGLKKYTEELKRKFALLSSVPILEGGIIPSRYMPSYVDDVLEFDSKDNFPETGESGKIYVDISTNLTYRWGGTAYVEISPSLALGNTSSTAFRGDWGKIAYDHSQKSHNFTIAGTSVSALGGSITSATLKASLGISSLEAYFSGGVAKEAAKVSNALTISNGVTSEDYDGSSPVTLTKTSIGLSQVENIKLSTWTGSTKITTLGTITTGVWNGTKIANDYLANPKITIGSTIVNLGGAATDFEGLTSLKFAGASGKLTYNSTDKYYDLADNLVVNGILAVGESGTGTSSGYTQLEWSDIKGLSKTAPGNLASAYAVKEVYTELNAAINALASSATKVSFAPNLTGGKVIGTLTIDGTGTILYAPQNYAWSEITGKPTFATVATSGSYTDLANKPTIASLMGNTAIGGTSSYLYWNGSAWATKALGSNAFTSISKVSQLTNDSGYITGITKAMVEGVLTGNITSHTHTFASLTDKPTTISGYGIVDSISLRNDSSGLYVAARSNYGENMTGSKYLEWWNSAGWVHHKAGKFSVPGGTSSQFLKADGSLDSTAYLPLSGGTLSNPSFASQLTINRAYSGGDAVIKFTNGNNVSGYIGVRADNTPVFYGIDTSGNGNELIHSGNYNSYAPKLDGTGASGTWGINISGNAASATNADTLDGVHYQNILERRSSGESSSGTTTGWFRIAATSEIDTKGTSFLLAIQRNYNYINNESYLFAISVNYNGKISITQLSGCYNIQLISKIRVDWKRDNVAYIDLYIANSSTNNQYYWYTVGAAKSYTTWTANPTLNGTAYEFTTVNGCKSDLGFTGNIAGNATSATKLQNSRTIWGQSFDGTQNVSGVLSDVNQVTFDANKTYGIFRGDWYSNALTRDDLAFSIPRAVFSGRVGIGSTSSSSILSVRCVAEAIPSLGALATEYTIEFGNAGKYGTYLGTLGSGNGFIQQGRSDGTAIAYNLFLQPLGGNVGIGTTSPSGKLTVNGAAFLTSGTDNNYSFIRSSNYSFNTARLTIGTCSGYSTEKLGLSIYNGCVGIGATATNGTYTLDVNGTAYASENIIAAGDLTAGSDIRYKDKIQDLRLSVHDIALAPAFTYKWNNREDALVHIGSSAQYWLNTDARDAVYYDKQNDFYHLNYASLALCNTIILARGMETQEEKIARLEERINELEDKLRQYDSCR